MKTAILISGELRTFQMCRKTMTFLDDPNVDIFVSTWDQSIINNERLNLHINDSITKEHIQNILQKDATILVEPSSCFESKRYNDKMIHRWLAGFEMIRSSSQKYDYVMVIRPDLFFHEDVFSMDSLILKGDKQFAWYEKDSVLQDNLFFGTFETIDSLFSRLTVLDWLNSEEGDWHTWWTDFVNWDDIERLGGHCQFTFCRSIVNENATFREVFLAEQDWQDMRIVDSIEMGNRSGAVHAWSEDRVKQAELKEKAGSFEHYKIKKPKVAVIISGMLRNYDAALLSLPIWGDTDRFLVTWDSAGRDKIDDYVKKANIKDTLVVLDSEIESIYCHPFNNYVMRMLYLWQSIFKHVPKDYDKYVIIRPDIFYWTEEICKVPKLIETEGPFKVDTGHSFDGSSGIGSLSDRTVLINKSHIYIFESIFSDMLPIISRRNSNSESTCIHAMLYELLWKYKPESKQLEHNIDTVIVRDTFHKIDSDEYNWELYKAIYYDTASWWRRIHFKNYGKEMKKNPK